MERKSNSSCWYYEVCQLDNSCDNCIRYTEMKYLMDNSGLPSSKQFPISLKAEDIDYDSFMFLADTKDNIVNFVEKGKNLLICGSVGNGKTSWSIKLLLKYFDEVWAGNGFRTRGLFVHVPTLLLKLKNFENPLTEEYKNTLINTDLVVWDELGGTEMSNYDYSQLLLYIDARISADKANIFTSNLIKEQEYKDKLGERIASRIYNTSEIVELFGKDRRK